ncbi:uncharacterized protein LOC141596664 [Silene latifolia]|uniref:uncharacterized protein LOC141596664 n=1 Tax=Silene latifolia TaxID=37657 RepID=UPI003D77F0A1
MQTPVKFLDTCNHLAIITPHHHHRFNHRPPPYLSRPNSSLTISCRNPNPNPNVGGERVNKAVVKAKGKDNVWSIDNEMAKAVEEKEKSKRRKNNNKGKFGKRVKKFGKGDNFIVSGSMLMEVENVLQTQEPVIRPLWNTFVSSVSGIWKGVGAVFSPTTAEMEPVEAGSNNEYLYDCYILSHLQAAGSDGKSSQIQRKINWVTLNPYGEKRQESGDNSGENGEGKREHINSIVKGKGHRTNHTMPKFESFNFEKSDVMEEDIMGMEPGLVFFEDGSYSRGPVDIPVAEVDDSNYYLSPTYKFEQCLVKGCHKRLRIVHTIEFSNGGADIQILRVAVYEEQWVGPANIDEDSEVELDMKPFSQRKRTRASELTGPWKVFEMSASPIYGDDMATQEGDGPPYVYLCMETMKKRSLPENPSYFGEEEMVDLQDVTVLWLPGGVTSYVDVSKDGILCIGVGWYSDEGINLVMERDYETDGKLREVRSKTEIKRRWTDPASL